MTVKVFRQGDVLFIPILKKDVPSELREIKSRLIRRGEHGGRHEIERDGLAKQVESIPPAEAGGRSVPRRRFLQVLGGMVAGVLSGVGIVHGEHNRLELPAREPSLPEHEGDYEVRIQRELQGNTARFVGD